MALQIGDAFVESSLLSQSYLTLYLLWNNLIYKLSLLDATTDASLAMRDFLISFAFLNPRPPALLRMHKFSQVRVCNQPAKTDPTQPTGLDWFLGLDGLGWVTKKILTVGQVGFGL